MKPWHVAPRTDGVRPCVIAHAHLRFVVVGMIQKAKEDAALLKLDTTGLRVTDLVRACENGACDYGTAIFTSRNIRIHGVAFADGGVPPADILQQWLSICRRAFGAGARSSRVSGDASGNASGNLNAIAIHCVAGLGRAPLLVALALIELGRMPVLDAVRLVRSARRGAFNARQLHWLEHEFVPSVDRSCGACSVM